MLAFERHLEVDEFVDLHDLIIVLKYLVDKVIVDAFEAVARAILKLNGVVLQAPFAALEGNDIVDQSEELRDGEVIGGGDVPEKLDIGHGVAPNHKAQTQVLLHLRRVD